MTAIQTEVAWEAVAAAAEAMELPSRFREVMGNVVTPVSIVTALGAGGPHGTTVSAFSSLSMSPPMVLVCLDRGSDLLDIVRSTGRFGLNVMGSGQASLAAGFARKGIDRFAGVEWTLEHGVPRLTGAPGWVACAATQLVPGGDHDIVLGLVLDAGTADGAPLAYHRRTFGTHDPLPADG